MESLGILLYALGGVVAAPIFCFLVARYSRRFPRLSAIVWWCSVGLLAVFLLDLMWVCIASAVRVRAALGPAFFPVHAFATLFAAPAFALLFLAGRRNVSGWWPAVAVLAWILGIFAIFYQYSVAEDLYGIDGTGGPYSRSSSPYRSEEITTSRPAPQPATANDDRWNKSVAAVDSASRRDADLGQQEVAGSTGMSRNTLGADRVWPAPDDSS